mmetsp:Transcript_19245/g.55982  ORF Transcript_19245/g.55982 Transcript_19245/m.55982 type:complete len:225 (+) Transcript_19245:103-777(+)
MLASSRTVLSAIRGWVVAAAALSLHRTSGFSLTSQSRASTLVRQAPRAFLNSGIQPLSLRGGTSSLTAPSAFQRAPLRWTATGSASAPVGFEALSVSELKSLLAERGVDFRDCIEKRELIARLEKAMQEGRTPKVSRHPRSHSSNCHPPCLDCWNHPSLTPDIITVLGVDLLCSFTGRGPPDLPLQERLAVSGVHPDHTTRPGVSLFDAGIGSAPGNGEWFHLG